MLQPELTAAAVAPLFAALGDPTRARILERLAREDRLTLTDLARHAPISRQAVSRHVAVLASAGLVAAERHGRELRLSVRREALAPATDWLSKVSADWDETLARLASHLENENG